MSGSLRQNRSNRWREFGTAVSIGYLLSATIVLLGVIYGVNAFDKLEHSDTASAIQSVLRRWDAKWYLGIVDSGYTFEHDGTGQNIAFFPLLPLLIFLTSCVSRLPLELAGLAVSNVALLLSLFVIYRYLEARQIDRPKRMAAFWAMVLVPWGFFWRFTYSESLFLLLSITAMYLMQAPRVRWWRSLTLTAVVIGLATAARPVGVSLLLPLMVHLRKCNASLSQYARCIPVACWGLVVFMAYQAVQFGDPFAFATTQQDWRLRPEVTFGQMLASFSASEPIWAVYSRDSYWYWHKLEPHSLAPLSLAFWNPVVLVGSAGLVLVGWRRRWLTLEETCLSAGLLGIPYFTRGFHFCMLSQARFASVAFPVYIVAGHLLASRPQWVRWVFAVLSALLLFWFSARFAAGYLLI